MEKLQVLFPSVVQSKNIPYQFQHRCLLDAKHVGLGSSSVGFRFETEALSIEKVKPGASFPPVQTWWRRFHRNMPKCSPVTCFPIERVESALNPNSISNEMRKVVASAIITQLLCPQLSSSTFWKVGEGGMNFLDWSLHQRDAFIAFSIQMLRFV